MKCRLLGLLLAGLALAQSQAGWRFYASHPGAYQASRDHSVFHSGAASARIQSTAAAVSQSFGLYWQKIDASRYRGQRLRLTGYLRSSGVRGWAGLWMRVDPKHGPALEFENMQRRPVLGSSDWKLYSIELEVADLAEEIHFGCLLVGQGEVWFDDLKLTAAGSFEPGGQQWRRARHLPCEAADPGFEQGVEELRE